MKIQEKILNPSEEELISEIVDTEYWPILSKLWLADELNMMKTGMTSNFEEEFHFCKGRLAEVKRQRKRILDIKKKATERKKNAV